MPNPRITPPPSSQHFNRGFHIFRTSTWEEYPWKTLIFTPPKTHSFLREDYCHHSLVNQSRFDVIEESRRRILEALAKSIDAFALHVSHHHSLQQKLNKAGERDFGSDGHVILRGLIKCIILDRFCWTLDLGVSGNCYQRRLYPDNDQSPVRDHKKAVRTTRMARTVIRVKESLPPHPSMLAGKDDDNYLGLAFATWYTGQSEASAVIANLCFASVACLCFIQGFRVDREMWERLAQRFKIDGCAYYDKLNTMIQHTDLASWKLWYRAVAVSPVLLLDPRFIRTDRSISAKELLSFINERVGVMPRLIWEAEKLVFQSIFDLIILWVNNAQSTTPQTMEHEVNTLFNSLFQSLVNLNDDNGMVNIEVLQSNCLPETGSLQRPVHETTANPRSDRGRTTGKERGGRGCNRGTKKNIPQLPEASCSSIVTEGDVTGVDSDVDTREEASMTDHEQSSPILCRPRCKRPRIDSDEEDEEEEQTHEEKDKIVSTSDQQMRHDLVSFMEMYKKGDFDEAGLRSNISDMQSYDECGCHTIKVWCRRVRDCSEWKWEETVWRLQWTTGMFHYRELDALLQTLDVCGDHHPSDVDSALYVDTILGFEGLSMAEQRRVLTKSHIHFVSNGLNEQVSAANVIRSMGISLVDPITIQDHRACKERVGYFADLLSCSTNARLDCRAELAVIHPSPKCLWKIDVSREVGFDNRAKVIYITTPPDRHVNSRGFAFPTWVRVVVGAQLWIIAGEEEKVLPCLLKAGDTLVLRANTPFTTITLTESVIFHGRFVTLFDFYRLFKGLSGSRKELNTVLLQLARFIHCTMLSLPNLDPEMGMLYHVADEELECLVIWLITKTRGIQAHTWACRLVQARTGMWDRVRTVIKTLLN